MKKWELTTAFPERSCDQVAELVIEAAQRRGHEVIQLDDHELSLRPKMSMKLSALLRIAVAFAPGFLDYSSYVSDLFATEVTQLGVVIARENNDAVVRWCGCLYDSIIVAEVLDDLAAQGVPSKDLKRALTMSLIHLWLGRYALFALAVFVITLLALVVVTSLTRLSEL